VNDPASSRDLANDDPPHRQGSPRAAVLLRWLLVALAIGVVVTSLLLERNAGAGSWKALRGAAPGPLLLAVLAAAGSWLLTSASLLLLTRAAGHARPMRQMWPAYMAGNFCGLVTPFGSGGTPGQAYFVSRLDVEPGAALAVAAARGLLSSTIVAVAAAVALVGASGWLPPGTAGTAARASLGVVAVLLVVATLLVVSERPGRWVGVRAHRAKHGLTARLWQGLASQTDFFRQALRAVSRRPAALAAAGACEVCSWMLIVVVGPLVLMTLGYEGPLWIVSLRVLALFMVIPMSPTPGSAGTAEVGFFVVGQGLVRPEVMAPAVLLWRAAMYYLPLFVGGIAFGWFGLRERASVRED